MNSKKRKLITAGIIMVFILIIAGLYLGGRYVFRDRFYPKTSMNGVDVGMKTKEEAEALVKDELAHYALGILSEADPMMITAAQSGLEYTGIEEITRLLDAQEEDLWFKDVMNVHELKGMGVKVDEAKLQETVNALPCMNPAEPRKSTDARIEFDATKNDFVIIDETIGNIVEPTVFYEAVKETILSGETILDMKTNKYYVQPKYFATDPIVTEAKATLDKYIGTKIHYLDFTDVTYELDGESIKTFLSVDKDFKIHFDKELMKQYIQDNISPVFNTVGTERTYTSPGSGIFKASGGTYGWQVGLIDEREAMIANIKKGEEVTREPMYLQDAKVKDRTDDIGNTFVDVNIEKQHLWVIKDGKSILDSAFVSGDVTKDHGTELGVYIVERNERNYRMVDYNVTVKYWMPFNLDHGEGFHDAGWRKSFGGEIYKGSGSHGCVNLPPKVAKKLFGIVSKGYPVIVH